MSRLRDLAHKLRVDTHAVWLAARAPETPMLARLFGMALAAYALSPIDLIPDFIPVLGLLDDAIILPAGLWLFLKMLPKGAFEHHRAIAEEASHRPVSWLGATLIGLIWLLAIAWFAMLFFAGRYY
jgi:uncharacterized membrane protein YkvA (DUF1232 family)